MIRVDLDALFAAAPSPYLLVDPDLRIVWVNDAYVGTVGRERGALIGRLLLEEFPAPANSAPDQLLRTSFRRVLETGKADHLPLIPYPIESAEGQIEDRFWSATHTPIIDADGKVEFILQNTMDVTELYRGTQAVGTDSIPTQAALLQRAETISAENLALGQMSDFFRSAFDQAPSFMAVINGPEHVFQIVNQSYTDLVGDRKLLGQTVRDALPELEGQGFFELLDQVYTSGEPVSIKGMAAQLKSVRTGKPEQHYIDFIYHPLKDETGATTGIFAQGHDVTGQKIAEAQLTATREKFRAMAQTMPNHVWTADTSGGLNWLNNRLYEFTGFSEGQLYGTDWARVVHPDDLDASAAKWEHAIAHGIGYETEFRIRKSDGTYRWHLVRASALHSDSGELTGWVGTNTDIEDRKNVEDKIAKMNATLETRVAERNQELEELYATLRQSQKMEAIGGLAGGIAHDFNNLLQVITGNLQLAGRDIAQASPAQERIEQAMKAVMRGATLASQLLSFARKQPLAPIVINLERLLSDTTEILQSAIGEGVEFETRIDDQLWNTNVDPNNLENALLNLAINARDAMDRQGKLTISIENVDLAAADVRSSPGLEAGQYVMLAVTDTGSGIPADVIERIFDPFFTTKEDGHGTGLGLSMVYGFAKQSGGHILIDSTVGTGTTVKLYLPRCLQEEAAARPINAIGMAGGTETILLVEDDNEVRETAAGMLSDLGYTVLEAPDAKNAQAILETEIAVDLLFTDVVMPGGSTGHDLAKIARNLRPDLPVLFSSGYVQDAIVHDGRLDEGVELLGKPYTQLTMAQKIRGMLSTQGTIVYPQQTPSDASVPIAKVSAEPANMRVLICEDDALIRMDIALCLGDSGYDVLEAATAQHAIEILHKGGVDLLITDIGLPDRSGEELANDARSINAALPIVFATGGADVPAAITLGNCNMVKKPFRDTELLEAISELVNTTSSSC
ncbi:PAS domain S-box-containing protein [Sulfitobacter undariae]|uniref:histidine kinase n=1 Tax=Sulfitobacter undariae TaxID=1563671 RepID=A0A7W6H1L2_9RHOB|nr:PAS domain-containing protein [Sulfitobacter undariae]MBB3995660.1 PAS domain S-box-containing protein [Sulfitobacter undariae]